MKKKGMTISQRIGHFFKHYFVLLLLALVCAVLTVLLVAYCVSTLPL